MGRKQLEILRQGDAGLPASSPRSGQIEISDTPFYHPILPLLCDSQHRVGFASGRAAADAGSAIRRMRATRSRRRART